MSAAVLAVQPSITCPDCGQTSYHPRDIEQGYCGHCHWWTSDLGLNRLTDLRLKAKMVCFIGHKGQERWDHSEYYLHPMAVSNLVIINGGNEETIIAAMLHDIVEDTDVSIEMIEKHFGKRVAELVAYVTKLPGAVYEEFIANLCVDPDAMLLKRCDIIHNMSTLTMSHKMNMRYIKALRQIHEAARKMRLEK